MMKTVYCVALVLCASATASAQFFTNQAAFQAQLAGPSYLEQFTGWTFGVPLSATPTWDSPVVNGYSYQASTLDFSTGGPGTGLFSIPNALSTNNQNDVLQFTFTGAPVTAFGGNFYGSDFDGLPVGATVTFITNNNDTFSHVVPDLASSFLGFVSPAPLVSVRVDSGGIAAVNWVAADNTITGAAVPEPSIAILGVLGLVGMAAARRR